VATSIGEIKEAIEKLVERRVAGMETQRGVDLRAQTGGSTDPLTAAAGTGYPEVFATGYDSGSGLTTLPFTWGLSVWGEDDIWTES